MPRIVEDGGIDRYDDLHVDQIDERFRWRKEWLAGARLSFEMALDLSKRHSLDVVVAVAFSLRSADRPIGVTFETTKALVGEFDWSPPSLYLFEVRQEPWKALFARMPNVFRKDLEPLKLLDAVVRAKTRHYVEFKQPEDAKYSRTVFLAA